MFSTKKRPRVVIICIQELFPFFREISIFRRRPVSKSSNYQHNFMKLGHNIKYDTVYRAFNNGPYPICLLELLPVVCEKNTLFMMHVL